MENTNRELVIILPEGMEDVPVRIIRNEGTEELEIRIVAIPRFERNDPYSGKRHVLVWHQNEYEHISLDEIMWVEASCSYCDIHATKDRRFTLSYPLLRVEERLPKEQFIRIQRSYLVNINHVKGLMGNSLIVGKQILKIGDEYKKRVLDEFIFLGVRNKEE